MGLGRHRAGKKLQDDRALSPGGQEGCSLDTQDVRGAGHWGKQAPQPREGPTSQEEAGVWI